jgi:hypothetical protein
VDIHPAMAPLGGHKIVKNENPDPFDHDDISEMRFQFFDQAST